MDELVGAAEIAERLGVGKSTVVHDWRRRYPKFPEPVAELSAGLVWAWPDVEKWAKSTGRVTVVEHDRVRKEKLLADLRALPGSSISSTSKAQDEADTRRMLGKMRLSESEIASELGLPGPVQEDH